uniref:Uncharacterized protein n=1 Tax=viral metagenome TaxID=1070528 RepID=A0A6C0C666_9ZZZZ
MELSIDWINDFEITDKDYKHFYKEPVNKIKLYCLYVNKNQELFHVKKDRIKLHNSELNKESLVQLLKKHMEYQNKKYTPLSILKYNITLNPQYIQEYINSPENFDYVKSESSIDAIKWHDSIVFLQEINSLYVILREKWKSKSIDTKKIYIKTHKSKRAKTRKKRLKDTTS